MTERYYVTTSIPYVNARPHLGHALELVQADVLARHRRRRGDEVRFLTGTDDNALKNVQAAEAAGCSTQDFVDANAAAFAALAGPLQLSFDDFIRTSTDPRHRLGVERLWRACDAAGDLYQRFYEGLYCVGCEQFYAADDLDGGRCREHGTIAEVVAEKNWFFRLSRYQEQLLELLESGRIRIEPESRHREALAFVRRGLADFSVSRSKERARGWGIPVPGDESQVVYVWWDALGNYVTALEGDDFRRWWVESDHRIHHIGKGILRFHAVYWPALLLSAGLPLPTDIFVHDYLTVDGQKLSKSSGNAVAPGELVERYGADPVRWWLLAGVPRVGDTDFTVSRLVAQSNADLAGGVGNLVNRTVNLVHRARGGVVPDPAFIELEEGRPLTRALAAAGPTIDEALADFDVRRAVSAITTVVAEANRFAETTQPWVLARDPEVAAQERLDAVLAVLVTICRALADHLEPFLPEAATRIRTQCGDGRPTLPPPQPVFPRLPDPVDTIEECIGGRAGGRAG